MSTSSIDHDDVDYRELLKHQTPEQRNIQRLEWRWARKLPKWERATRRAQAWYRGRLGRAEALRAREIKAPMLKSRSLCVMADGAVREGRYDEAMGYVNESIEQHSSTYWSAYSLRGRLRFREGNVLGALEDLSVCVREAPGDRVALKTRARVYISMKRWEEASRDLSAGLRVDPNDTDNYSGAVYDFGMIIDRIKVPTAADFVRRACAYCCGQNWQKALEDLGRSIATRETAQALAIRGRVLACMRKWKLAIADFDAALEIDPSNATASEGRDEALTPYVLLPMLSEEDAARIAAGE